MTHSFPTRRASELPAIDELRRARGHAVLTEAELFTMQIQALGTLLPLPESHAMDSRAAQDQARRYLSAFQVSLLSWIRNAPDAKIAETRIGKKIGRASWRERGGQ